MPQGSPLLSPSGDPLCKIFASCGVLPGVGASSRGRILGAGPRLFNKARRHGGAAMPALIPLACCLIASALSRPGGFGQRQGHARSLADDADFACVGASKDLEDEECRAWQSIWLSACSAGGAACAPSPTLCPDPLTDPCSCRSPAVTINCAKPAPFFSRVRMTVVVLRSVHNHHWHVQPRQFASFPTLGTLDIEIPSDARRGRSHFRGEGTKARAGGMRQRLIAATAIQPKLTRGV